MKKVSVATKLSFNEKEGKVRFTHMCTKYLRFFVSKWHSLCSLPFQGVKMSRFSGPTLLMALEMDLPESGSYFCSCWLAWGQVLRFGEGKRILALQYGVMVQFLPRRLLRRSRLHGKKSSTGYKCC